MSVNARPTPPSRLILVRLLRFVRPFKMQTALAVWLGVLTIGSSIGLLATSAFILARAAQHPSIADLAVAIVGVRFFGIARGGFRYLERLVSHYVNLSLLAQLRVWLYQVVEPIAPTRWIQAGHHSGDVLTRIVSDIETLQNLIVRIVAPPLVALAIALLMMVYLSAYETRLALSTLFFMVLAGIALPALVRRLARHANRRLISIRAELNTMLLDTIQGMADLVASGREQSQLGGVDGLASELTFHQTRMAALSGMHNALGGLAAHLAMWSVLVLAIPIGTEGLSPVYLGVLALAVLTSFEGALALPMGWQYLDSSLEAGQRLFELADDPPDRSTSQGQHDDIASPLLVVPPAICVNDLSFRYAPGMLPALDRISFEVPAGGSLAIVGPSGAGKSTLANLMLRFAEYDSGSIRVGGQELRLVSPDTVRQWFGVVPQTTHLFNATIRDNLLLARATATASEVQRAAEMAQIDGFISSLPAGYDTRIGEQGFKLSGGERQRLALARALLKNAPILLLDEPTANLDPQTERAVLETLRSLRGKKTMIWITHRLAGLEESDQVLVLNGGKLVERGRHDELMQLHGMYLTMWQMQREVLARGE